MSHLLQAVGSLHEAGHTKIMRGLLQLFLPQGKYSNVTPATGCRESTRGWTHKDHEGAATIVSAAG